MTGTVNEAEAQATADLISELAQRPRRADKLLPLIWLIGSQHGGFLEELDGQLNKARPRQVPRTRVDATAHPLPEADPEARTREAARLLRELVDGLSVRRFGFARLRFRHFTLVEWLMRLDLAEDSLERRDRLARELRHHLRHQDYRLAEEARQHAGTWMVWVLLVLRLLMRLLFQFRVNGRPEWGKRFRWFMRQQYLAPRLSNNFLDFAERLTEPARHNESPEQVAKLLVHAFLEDLRHAYVRKPWRLEGHRRTAYCLALLEGVAADNAGYALLELINAVRNETGAEDPLLVVATATMAHPPEVAGRRVVAVPTGGAADEPYERWKQGVPESRTRQEPSTWHLPLLAPAEADGNGGPLIRRPVQRPPRWASRSVVSVACLVLFAGACLALIRHDTLNCGTTWSWFSDRVSVRKVGDTCIGFSDSEDYVFSADDQRLAEAQERVFAQNARAAELHEQQPDRPYVTLVYFGQLTAMESFAAASEDLEGISMAQREMIDPPYQDAPLLRVIVANGGPKMGHSLRTLDMLEPVAADDPSIIGVTGLDESRKITVELIRRLSTLGLPVLGTSLSADDLHQVSPLYFQLAPPNHEQAEMIATAVAQPGVLRDAPADAPINPGSHTYLYHRPDPDDLYTSTLAAALRASLTRRGLPFTEVHDFREVSALCDDRPSNTAIFAGRGAEFNEFINAVGRTCGDNQPAVVADDSANRYMAYADLRRPAELNRPLIYVAKSVLVDCDREPDNRARDRFRTLLDQDRRWKPCAAGTKHPFGERVALSYDATQAFRQAVDRLELPQKGRLRPTASNVWARLRELPAFDGVTGVIDFAGGIRDSQAGYEPANKRQALLGVDEINDLGTPPRILFTCGRATIYEPGAVDEPSPGCPAPGE